MRKELKLDIINFMFENDKEFQLVNATNEKFRQYIYDNSGNYCIGGEEVHEFILSVDKLLKY